MSAPRIVVVQRNGHRPKLVPTPSGGVELGIPKLRKGSFFPELLEPRPRIDKAIWAVIMTADIAERRPGRSTTALRLASLDALSPRRRRRTDAIIIEGPQKGCTIAGERRSCRAWRTRAGATARGATLGCLA